MNNQKLALPSVGVLFKESWALYKSRFLTLIGIILIPVVLPVLLIYLFPQVVLAPSLWILALVYGVPIAFSLVTLLLVLLYYTLITLVFMFASLAMVYSIKDGSGMIKSYGLAFSQFWRFIWLNVLDSLIILGGAILLVVPGIIFAIWFMFGMYVMAAENRKAFDSLLKSKEYVAGYWWAVLGRFLLLALVFLAFVAIISPFPDETEQWLTLLIQLILSPFAAAFIYALYRQFTLMRGEVASSQVAAKRGFFIFAAVLGLVAPFVIAALVYFL